MQMAADKQIIIHSDEKVASWNDRFDCLDRELMTQLWSRVRGWMWWM